MRMAKMSSTGQPPIGTTPSTQVPRYAGKAQQIASQIGYKTGTALSRAFARHHAVAPGAWRRHHQMIRKDRG